MTWRLAAHTADLAIEAEAPTHEAALCEAALALAAVVTDRDDPHRLGSEEEIRFFIEAPDEPALVVAFLAELLWLQDSKDLLWTGGGVTLGTSTDGILRLDAAGNGVRYDPAKHGQGVEVKAITYHELVSERQGAVWQIRVLLDL